MLPEGARVLCAVSGGADSVCLLHYLITRGGNDIVCAHYNHRLRGADSDRDEAFVKKLCKALGLACHTGSGDVEGYARKNGMGIEEAARTLRYAFLEKTAEAVSATKIATAHNAGDNAETVLFNLARGSALRGACGIPPVRGNIVRPLLMTTRREIEGYLEENDLLHVEDTTNESDAYTRNKIRHRILPVLEEVNPAAIENISTSTLSLREDEEYLRELAQRFLDENFIDGSIPAKALKKAPRPVAARALKLVLKNAGRVHIDAVLKLCEGTGPAYADIPGMRVARERNTILFGTPQEIKRLPKRHINLDNDTAIPEPGLIISCKKVKKSERINNSFNTFFFNYESICGRIFVASRMPGAKIALDGRGCTKTLKKLFAEAGLTIKQREETPVFYDELGVIAVCGFGVAQRCAVKPGDDDIIKIEIRKQDG